MQTLISPFSTWFSCSYTKPERGGLAPDVHSPHRPVLLPLTCNHEVTKQKATVRDGAHAQFLMNAHACYSWQIEVVGFHLVLPDLL